MNLPVISVETNSSHVELFNFSYHQVSLILDEHLKRDKIFPPTMETFIIVSYAILMITGMCANIMVSSVIMHSTKCCSSRNYYVVNLNASDIALCMICMPFTALTLVRRNWSLGPLLCKLVPFLQGSTVFVSAATVSAIAMDRYYAIVSFNPQKPKKGKRKFTLHLLLIWISSIILSMPICIAQQIIVVGLPGLVSYEKCIENWPLSGRNKGMYTVVILLTQFFIPITVLTVTHFRIKKHLNFSYKRRDFRLAGQESERLHRELNRNQRATMILMNISLVFTVSWLPWNILNLLADFKPHLLSPQDLYLSFAICHILAMTSATTNPILYGWLNTNIRRELQIFRQRMGIALLNR